jgi:hypothetical protein
MVGISSKMCMMYCSKTINKIRGWILLCLKLCKDNSFFIINIFIIPVTKKASIGFVILLWNNTSFLIQFPISETILYWNMYSVYCSYLFFKKIELCIFNTYEIVTIMNSMHISFLDMNHTHICVAIIVGIEDRALLFVQTIAVRNISPSRPRPSWNLWGL